MSPLFFKEQKYGLAGRYDHTRPYILALRGTTIQGHIFWLGGGGTPIDGSTRRQILQTQDTEMEIFYSLFVRTGYLRTEM